MLYPWWIPMKLQTFGLLVTMFFYLFILLFVYFKLQSTELWSWAKASLNRFHSVLSHATLRNSLYILKNSVRSKSTFGSFSFWKRCCSSRFSPIWLQFLEFFIEAFYSLSWDIGSGCILYLHCCVGIVSYFCYCYGNSLPFIFIFSSLIFGGRPAFPFGTGDHPRNCVRVRFFPPFCWKAGNFSNSHGLYFFIFPLPPL